MGVKHEGILSGRFLRNLAGTIALITNYMGGGTNTRRNAGVIAEFAVDDPPAATDLIRFAMLVYAAAPAILTGLYSIIAPDIRTWTVPGPSTSGISVAVSTIKPKVRVSWTDDACAKARRTFPFCYSRSQFRLFAA